MGPETNRLARDDAEFSSIYMAQRHTLDACAASTRALVETLVRAEQIEVARVECRVKTLESTQEKIERHSAYRTIDDVTDLVGIRIVCFYKDDVPTVTDLLRREFSITEQEQHRADGSPDAFGYTSTHLLGTHSSPRSALTEYSTFADVRTEFQVRTVLEDAWATISHKLDYKLEGEAPSDVRRTLFRAAALIETSDDLFNKFRRDVIQLRSTYSQQIDSNRADLVEINKEAIAEMWSQIDAKQIVITALNSGFRALGTATDGPSGLPGPSSRLMAAARSSGRENIGEILAVANSIETYRPLLEDIAARSTSAGYQPFAVAEDILTFIMSSSSPESIDVLEGLGLNPSIVKALRQISKE